MNINEVINISSKADLKGFKQAETASQKLGRTVKNLAGTFGLAFGTAAVLNYAKKSVKAAADDQKAQQQLALALKNVGLERDAASTEKYIGQLQSEFGILDDLLRPAYQRLAVATQNTAESQRLLNLALDISASTGKDVVSVSTALSRAFLGNNTALTRLGVGLSKADLKTKSFEEITNQLSDTFAGSATAAASTFSGQLGILSAGAAEATEIIGTGLIDSLKLLSTGGSISNVVTDMQSLATAISDTTTGIALFIKEIKAIPVLGSALGFLFEDIGTGIIFSKAGKERRERLSYNKNEHMSKMAQVKSDTKITKLGSQQLSTAKKLAATQKQIAAEKKKQEVLDKAALVLAEGQKLFDEEGIQLAAAAQGKLTDEEKARLAIKKDIYDLEAAINEGNVSAAARLANSMVANAQKLAALRTDMDGLNYIQNPFDAWLLTIQRMAYELSMLAMVKPVTSAAAFFTPEQQATADMLSEARARIERKIQGQNMDKLAELQAMKDRIERKVGIDTIGTSASPASFGMDGSFGGTSVIVNVAGSVSTERDLVAAITQGLYTQQASGTPVTYSTVY
jgi:hypothetical protein